MKTETKDQLRAKIEDLEKRNEVWAIAHERIRQSLIEANHQLHACQVADPDFADKYQVVDPENAYWMENAEALIEISTGCLYEVDNVRKRVCTIPIPILQGNWRWDQEKETREENNARREKCCRKVSARCISLRDPSPSCTPRLAAGLMMKSS